MKKCYKPEIITVNYDNNDFSETFTWQGHVSQDDF